MTTIPWKSGLFLLNNVWCFQFYDQAENVEILKYRKMRFDILRCGGWGSMAQSWIVDNFYKFRETVILNQWAQHWMIISESSNKLGTITNITPNTSSPTHSHPIGLPSFPMSAFHCIYNNMINQLEAIQEALRLWRGVVLTLTVVMLFISLLADDDMVIIVLIICFFALILFQLRNLPSTSYQLFILLLLAYFIFICGKFLEGFYDRTDVTFTYVSKNIYNMFVIAVFIVVLWRHYQKESLINRLEFDDNANIF